MTRAAHPTTRRRAKQTGASASSKGHTLLELAIAMSVFAALAAAFAPRLLDSQSAARTQAAESLRADLQLARASAMAAGRVVRASFGPRHASFCWTSDCPPEGGGAAPALGLGGAPIRWSIGAPDELSAPGHVDFGPDGAPSSAPTLSIGLAKIAIDPVTGIASRVD